MHKQRIPTARGERGQALVEAAIILPVVLLIMTGIFEIGRAYQTYQVLTNAAREGARAAVVTGGDAAKAKAIVNDYIAAGMVEPADGKTIEVTVDKASTIVAGGETYSASLVTVDFPFEFAVLQGIAQLVNSSTGIDDAFTMRVTCKMRNETS